MKKTSAVTFALLAAPCFYTASALESKTSVDLKAMSKVEAKLESKVEAKVESKSKVDAKT